jgi:hypothetical protein
MRMTEHAQPAHGGCGYEYLIQSLGLEGVIVGAIYSTINGVREDFTYSEDANSSLGVALPQWGVEPGSASRSPAALLCPAGVPRVLVVRSTDKHLRRVGAHGCV